MPESESVIVIENHDSHTAGIFLIVLPSKGERELRTVLVLGKAESVLQADGSTFAKPRMWGLPKGRMKPEDEDIIATATREFCEETGIFGITRDMLDLGLSVTEDEPSLRLGSSKHHKTFFLVVMNNPPKIGIPTDDKIERAQYFSLSELPVSGGAKLAKSHARAMGALLDKFRGALLKAGVHPMILAMCEVDLAQNLEVKKPPENIERERQNRARA